VALKLLWGKESSDEENTPSPFGVAPLASAYNGPLVTAEENPWLVNE
jgi:hypothetical protein